MAGKDIIMATQEELKALDVIHKAIDKVITQKEAAETVDLSEHQTRGKIKKNQGRKGIGVIFSKIGHSYFGLTLLF